MRWRFNGMNVCGMAVTVCLLLAAAVSPAAAEQSTNAKPVIIMNTAAVDPASLPDVGKGALDAIKNLTAQVKSGALAAFVFAASPNGKTWEGMSTNKGAFLSYTDLARQSLERCEYLAGGPCIILSVNGHDARDSHGGWPLQPPMFARGPSRFDPMRVPFISFVDRAAVAGYATASGPRAYVVTPTGNATWDRGKTAFDAIAKARAHCQKSFPGKTCLLYAVNDFVVLSP